MFKKKKKTSFEPDIGQPPDDPEFYPEPQQHEHEHGSHHQMGRSNAQQILNNLALSPNDFAAGIAMCVKALAEATSSPPTSPIIVEYRSRRMVFGRRNLGRMDGNEAIRIAVRTIYPQGNVSDSQRFVVEATLFAEDGRPDRRVVGVDLDSWGELLPYIHTLYLRLDVPPTSPRDRDRDRERERDRGGERERDRGGDRDRRDRDRERERERERERPRRDSTSGAERREERPPEASGVALERSQSQNEGYPPAE